MVKLLVAMACGLSLAACGGSEDPDTRTVELGQSLGAEVTQGSFATFAAGVARGFDIGGKAQMIRTADGRTIVKTHVTGLASNTSYPSHVHAAACGVNEADGHYKQDPAGPATPPNEIWPAFTTNEAGIGNGKAVADFTARPEAQSVVVHDTDGAKIGCADLE